MMKHGSRFFALSTIMGTIFLMAPYAHAATTPAMQMHDMQGMEHMEGMEGMEGMTHHPAPAPHPTHRIQDHMAQQNGHPSAARTGPLGMPEAVRAR